MPESLSAKVFARNNQQHLRMISDEYPASRNLTNNKPMIGHERQWSGTRCIGPNSPTLRLIVFALAVALLSGVSSQVAVAATDFCQGGILDQGAPLGQTGPDLVIYNMTCTVDGTKAPYNFHNVYIFGSGGTGTLQFENVSMDFYAENILVQNNGVLEATGIGADNGGQVLIIHLYGPPTDPGVTCKKMDGSGNVVDDVQCGVPTPLWISNPSLAMRSMRYPQNHPAMPCMKGSLPGGVNDCFYQYDVFDTNDVAGAYFGHKVLALSYGGTINLSGYKGAQGGDDNNPAVTGSSWMRLNATLNGGENSLTVTGMPSDWKANDYIVVTATDYLPGHAEQLQIASVSGSTVNLMGSVKNPHWGQTYSLDQITTSGIGPDKDPNVTCTSPQKNCVEERAAVGLLSRSIRIISEGDTAEPNSFPASPCGGSNDPKCYYGGHTVARQGFLSYQIQGVEFYQLGQGGAIGHYPVHFHMARQVPQGTYVKDSSTWDSMTRWITVHATQGVTLARNVGYKSIGHGFYLEDGTEAENVLNTNLGVFARAAVKNTQINDRNVPGILAEPGDPGAPNPYHSDWQTPSVFWIMNGWNEFQYNFASSAGTCGACYWYLPGGTSVLSQFEYFEGYAGQQAVIPNLGGFGDIENQAGYSPLKKFVGNSCSTAMEAFLNIGEASACNGVTNDGTTGIQAVPNPVAPAKSIIPEMDNYYPYVTGLRLATVCVDPSNCANTVTNIPCGGRGVNLAYCPVTTLERFTTSFNWAEKNFSAIWLRPWWFLVENSAIMDVQQGGITFVTSGGYTRADVAQGYWSLLRKSALVGNTQLTANGGQPLNPYASSGGPFNPNGLQCDQPEPPEVTYCQSKDQDISYPTDAFVTNQRLVNIYDGPSYQERNAYLDIPVIRMGKRSKCTDNNGSLSCPAFGYFAGLTSGVPADTAGSPADPECYLPNAAIAWKQSNGFFYPPAFHSQSLFFNNVDIRHFVIEPLFKYGTFTTDQDAVRKQYCTYDGNNLLPPSGDLFANFTDIDRQTVLNDDDGSLTGLLADLGGGVTRETLSINKDTFFNVPPTSITPECASDVHDGTPAIGPPATADTSPYEYVTTATIAQCGLNQSGCVQQPGAWSAWGFTCSAGAGPTACYGVPMYRQLFTDQEYSDYMLHPSQYPRPVIRMMGQNTGQRSTLTVNHGVYYIDDQVGRQKQSLQVGPVGNLNVYLPSQTYYTYFLYAKPSLNQTYEMFVGYGLNKGQVIASVQPFRVALPDLSFVFTQASGPSFLTVDYDDRPLPTGTGLVTINVNLQAYESAFTGSTKNFCQPTTYCQSNPKNDQQCVCAPGTDCTDDSVCSWAIKDIDCPNTGSNDLSKEGCFAFGITLPDSFQTGVAKPPAPMKFSNDPNFNWNVGFYNVAQDVSGEQCYYSTPPRGERTSY